MNYGALPVILQRRILQRGLVADSHNGSLLWEPWDEAMARRTGVYLISAAAVRRRCHHASPADAFAACWRQQIISGTDGLRLRRYRPDEMLAALADRRGWGDSAANGFY